MDSFINKISEYTAPKMIELFVHECCLNYESKIKGISIKQLCEEVIRRVSVSGYHFGFAQEVYDKMYSDDDLTPLVTEQKIKVKSLTT